MARIAYTTVDRPQFHWDTSVVPTLMGSRNPSCETPLAPGEYAHWRRTSLSIQIPAPRIRMRVISANEIHDGDALHGPALSSLIIGMCLDEECWDTGLQPYVTVYADLFASEVPLSPEQEHAVGVLNGLAPFNFWLQAVCENGVEGHDQELRDAYDRAMRQIKASINPDRAPESRNGPISWGLRHD